MPLNIYIKDYEEAQAIAEVTSSLEGLPLIWDIEKEFHLITLLGTDTEREIIAEIEQGKYLDNLSFLDRFGYKLRREYLSTGCKVALTVLHNPDKIINTVECGMNALGTIITYCKDGNILIYTDEQKIPYIHDTLAKNISVQLDGIHFTDFDKLNSYIADR